MKRKCLISLCCMLLLSSCNQYEDYAHIGEEASVNYGYTIKVNSISFKDSYTFANEAGETKTYSPKGQFLILDALISRKTMIKPKDFAINYKWFKIKDSPGNTPSFGIYSLSNYQWNDYILKENEIIERNVAFDISTNVSKDTDLFLEFDISASVLGVDIYLKNRE